MNITLDDTSPQFQYRSKTWNPGWITNHTAGEFRCLPTHWVALTGSPIDVLSDIADGSTEKYFGSTFYGTYTDGDSVSLTFNGSAVYIYGAKRDNHGVYSTQLDDGQVSFVVGQSTTDLFQQVLFYAGGLSDDREHTVTLTNLPSDTSPPADGTIQWWMDVDYAVITTHTTGKIYTTVFDDTNTAVQYTGTTWTTDPLSPTSYHNSTAHITQKIGESYQLNFNGSSIQLFGGLFTDHGNYSVSIDGALPDVFNGTYFKLATQVSMYQASNLTDGPHTLTVTNLGGGAKGSFMDFDFAVVNSTIDPNASGTNSTGNLTTISTATASPDSGKDGNSSNSTAGAIAGGVVGGIIGLALVVVLAWFLFKRSKSSHEDDYNYPKKLNGRMDLTGEEIKPYEHGSSSNAYSLPTMSHNDSSLGYPTSDLRQLSAREADQSRTPFLSQVPPPPPSNATSYPQSVNPYTQSINPPSSIGSPPPLPELESYPNPFTSVSDTPSDRTVNFAAQLELPPSESGGAQSQYASSQQSGSARGTNDVVAPGGKTASVALPYTAYSPASHPQPTSPARVTHQRNSSADRTSVQRMFVPGREQDMGPLPVHEEEGDHTFGTLPPDYHQATEPLQGQVQRTD